MFFLTLPRLITSFYQAQIIHKHTKSVKSFLIILSGYGHFLLALFLNVVYLGYKMLIYDL